MIPSHHDIKIVANDNPSAYPLKVKCSCQFEALALNDEMAEHYASMHLSRHPLAITTPAAPSAPAPASASTSASASVSVNASGSEKAKKKKGE